MSDRQKPAGVWSAAVTPIDARLQPDVDRAVAHYGQLLDDGCSGVAVLGTTGEAMSLSLRQRVGFIEGLATRGLPMNRAIVGAGAANLEDAALLMRCAFDAGCAAALVMPPFFFRDATDDGIVRYFDAVFARTPAPRHSVLLYHFPRMSGITFHADLVDRLIAEFPEAIVGMKDSSNDRALQAQVLARHPQFAVFPGSESYLLDALAVGAAGCISGSVCLWSQLARDVLADGNATSMRRMRELRAALDGLPLVAAVRYLLARSSHDDAWATPLPPLVALDAERGKRLVDALGELSNGDWIDGGAA
jgi:4-hydroxy-tetrahydrodipicolinate synthase